MASSSSSLLTEEQLRCPICLEVFTQPVSTPCGHNFCMSCITTYWSSTAVSHCPLCKESFDRKPFLKVNTLISELALQFKLLQVTDLDQQQAGRGSVVFCDICTDTQQEAVKSCVQCLTSYCDVHLEPHRRVPGLKTHTLVGPLASLEEKMCKQHTRLLIMFCRNHEVLLCDICTASFHMNDDVVPVQQAYTEMKARLEEAEAKVQQMIQERHQKVRATRESVKQSEAETKDVIADGVQGLTALVSEIQKSQTELVKVMEEKQKAAEEQAGQFISSMEQEIVTLQTTAMKMEELQHTEDRFRFIRELSGSSLLPHTMDLSTYSLNRHVEINSLGRSLSTSVSRLQMLLNKMNTEIRQFSDGAGVSNDAMLRYLKQYEEDVVLDADTAHPLLIISSDRKQVRYSMGSGLWGNQILNPNMFTEHLAVLGLRGFLSKFYFEVFVGDKTEWCLGVATASIPRWGSLSRGPDCGLWAIWFLGDKFETYSSPNVPVYSGKVETVGVFVDYDRGQICFYNVQNAEVIYSFTECVFTEELYPYFNPCDNEYGSNLGPMIIVPVSRTE